MRRVWKEHARRIDAYYFEDSKNIITTEARILFDLESIRDVNDGNDDDDGMERKCLVSW